MRRYFIIIIELGRGYNSFYIFPQSGGTKLISTKRWWFIDTIYNNKPSFIKTKQMNRNKHKALHIKRQIIDVQDSRKRFTSNLHEKDISVTVSG